MREEVVTENVHSMIGICWNLKRRKRRCSTSNSWGDLYQRKKTTLRIISEKQNSVIHGDLYQLEIIIRWLILGEKHPVIQKVINFREGWWGEGKGEVDLTQKPRNLTSTNLIGWGIHNIKYCSNSSHYNFFAPK